MVTQVYKRRAIYPRDVAAKTGPIDRLLRPELFKALCDPTRASLISCLAKRRRPCAVSEVAECCSVDLSVVSRHLAQLVRAGLLRSLQEGRTVRYEMRYGDLCAARSRRRNR